MSRMSTPPGAPAEEAGGDADERADHDGEHGRREPDEQADPRAPDELRQHAAAEVVRAERAELGGLANAGLPVALIACSPSASAISGAASAIGHDGEQDPQADHPGR